MTVQSRILYRDDDGIVISANCDDVTMSVVSVAITNPVAKPVTIRLWTDAGKRDSIAQSTISKTAVLPNVFPWVWKYVKTDTLKVTPVSIGGFSWEITLGN